MDRQINILLVLVVAFLFGCNSGFKGQDPLEGQPENIRQAIPPEEKIDSPANDILPEDALIIDADLFYEFVEGKKGVVKISSRSMLPDTTYTLDLEYVEQRLVSASTTVSPDGHTQTLEWTPPHGFVGDLSVKRMNVTVVIHAKRGKTYLSRRQDIQIVVYRKDKRPEIVEIIDLPEKDGVREGQSAAFKVVVRDPESVSRVLSSAVVGSPPQLRFVRTSEYKNLVPFLKLIGSPQRSKEDPELWMFNVRVELNNESNLSRNRDTYYFGLQAVNRHSNPSRVSKQELTVYSDLFAPFVTWGSEDFVIFQEGKENYFSFAVFDPRQEGEVSIEWITDWKKYPGLVVSCQDHKIYKEYHNCLIMWTPKSLDNFELPKAISLEFKTINFPKAWAGNFKKESFQKRSLLIQKNGHPPVLSELEELKGAKLHEERNDSSNTREYGVDMLKLKSFKSLKNRYYY